MNAPAPTAKLLKLADELENLPLHDPPNLDVLARAAAALRQAASVERAEVVGEAVGWQWQMADGNWCYADPPDEKELKETPERFRRLYLASSPRSEGVRASEVQSTEVDETELELLAGKLAGAELNYRNAYERFGGGHIETGRKWDKMRRAGDAIREYKFQSERDDPSPAAQEAKHCGDTREVLLFSSYCGGENSECTEVTPCPNCLRMSNVFRVPRSALTEYVRELHKGGPKSSDPYSGPSVPSAQSGAPDGN